MLDTYIVMFPEYDLFLIISDQMHWSNFLPIVTSQMLLTNKSSKAIPHTK